MPAFPEELLQHLDRAWSEQNWELLDSLYWACELNEVLQTGLTTADFVDHLLQHWPKHLMDERWRVLLKPLPHWHDFSDAAAAGFWRAIDRATPSFSIREAELAGEALARECLRTGSIKPVTDYAASPRHQAGVTVSEAIRWLSRDEDSPLRTEAISLQSRL